ncbi:MAG: dihydrolipoyl dehydrogenase [Verrucomicrobiales bacterium]|jgi:dihydrolipoamide dehydrogenase|nr:dihydrolipoyl dehydrogenase [Verrucomicrobiales bacterium]
MEYDLIVVGGGPAGYVGAIRAAQLGKKVACVERERAGGTCLNWGCIPTKALLRSAEIFSTVRRAADFGVNVSGVTHDFERVVSRSRGVTDTMARGIEFLFRSKKVDYVRGQAKITRDKTVIVSGADGGERALRAENILLATGARARLLSGLRADGQVVLTSREALMMRRQPKSIVIIGGGAIGVEFAYFFNVFGTRVTLIEALPRILPVEDHEVSALLARSFTRSGIDVLTGAKVDKIETGADGVRLTVSGRSVEAEALLVSIGVVPNLDGVLADGLKLELDAKGWIATDSRYQTSVSGIYAAGDVIGPPLLAHVASHEAIAAVEGMFVSGCSPRKVTVFPACTYCQPQVASVGLTENAAREQGVKFRVGKFPYRASGRAVAAGEPEGFVKLIISEPRGEVLGAHIVGAEATELIGELGLAVTLGATDDEIGAAIHAHPTLTEMIAEACAAAKGAAVHI